MKKKYFINYDKKKSVVVFGGSGFIGSYVAEYLHYKGYKVIIADLKRNNELDKKIKFEKVDILNKKKVNNLVKKASIVFNFAAIADIQDCYDDPLKCINVNIIGCANILNSCVKNNIRKFVLASSIYAGTSQGGFYRVSKLACENLTIEYSKIYNINYNILRYGSIYGLRSDLKNGIKKIIFNSLKKNKLIYQGTNKASRSFIHVKDAAKASVEILNKKFINKIILIKGKKNIKIIDLLLKLKKILKINSKLYFLNKTEKGHYDIKPKEAKKLKMTVYYTKNPINFEQSLNELIDNIKLHQ